MSSAIDRIAFYQDRRDEVPNQELARDLAANEDRQGVREIAENLWNKNANVQSDCLKVLYEIGYLKPELVADYAGDFLKLLKSKHNRLVWGAMIALSTVASRQADEIYAHLAEIEKMMDGGSVITRDNGVKVLAALASASPEYRAQILPYLLHHLETCRPKDVPQHSEAIVQAIDPTHRAAFTSLLEQRMEELTAAQRARLKKVIKAANASASPSK